MKRLDRRSYLNARLVVEQQPTLAQFLEREDALSLSATVDDLSHLAPVGTDQRKETFWWDIPLNAAQSCMVLYAPPRNAVGFLRTLSARQRIGYWLLDFGVGHANRNILAAFTFTGVVMRSPHYGTRLAAPTNPAAINTDEGLMLGGITPVGYTGGYLVQDAYALTHHEFPVRFGWALMILLDPPAVNQALNVGLTVEEYPVVVQA